MKIIDQIYHCLIPGEVFGTWQLQCHLRIFQPHPEIQTVVITDMGFEFGWFIPYLVEALIDRVIQEFDLEPSKLAWIEHYTPEFRKPGCADFSQVVFSWQSGKSSNPQWIRITAETAQALIGENLELVALQHNM